MADILLTINSVAAPIKMGEVVVRTAPIAISDVGIRLPGPKGDKGDKGDAGNPGSNGYTPVRGTDYWTAADITTMESYINSYVNTVILGGAS